MKSMLIDSGGPVMPRSKSRDREIGREVGTLEVRDTRRRGGRGHEPVVEIRGGAAAEVGADREVQGSEHLEQHEHDADRGERCRERVAALHRADQCAGRDGEPGGEQAAQREQEPPSVREAGRRAKQRAEELVLLATA